MLKKRLLSLDLRHEDSAQPKHERLREHLVNEIIAGRLEPGGALPSEHHLVKTLGIARTTVRQAMASLESDGLIRRVQGKGTYVEPDVKEKLRQDHDVFALVVPETRAGFYPSLLYGFDAAAGEMHHQTLVCNTDNNVDKQGNIILQLLDKKVGGVAINPTSLPLTPAFQIRQLQERGIPVVFCHRRVEGISAPLLAIPFRDVARMAGKAFADRGHRHVALIDSHRSSVFPEWEAGLVEALQADGREAVLGSYCAGDSIVMHEEEVFATLEKVLAGPDRPTAVFAPFDTLAEMIYLLLPRLGLRVPEDVSVVGFGGTWREGILTRRLTSVVIDEAATGQKAVSLLHEMRCGNRSITDNEEIVLGVELSDGVTLGVRAASMQKAS